MKTYIVYVNGKEKGMIRAAHHNAAEKKAKEKYSKLFPGAWIDVAYTEV